MTYSKNMDYTEPQNMRKHYCFIFKEGRYVGSLYLSHAMRKLWRHNKYSVVMTDV